jgi:MoaD family protein
MKVIVRIFGDLTPIFGHKHAVELDERSTVGILANRIAEKYGATRQGYLGKYKVGGNDLAVLVNGRNIHLLEGSDTILHDSDEVVILPPAAGG